ncbi:autotransporter-associated beta strand repeat-containing protein [Akkermansiaceae bacterium]|nr:autotransporter-associated beta strand repeat-containing protein [Akkermansiaceae bacterium]
MSTPPAINLNFTSLAILTCASLLGSTAADDVKFAAATESNASGATMDHFALATGRMTAADAAWTAGDWEQVRSALPEVFNDPELSAPWRSIAHLRYARSYQAAGDFQEAGAIFGVIANNKEYPKIHQIEGAECKAECDRLAQGKPGRDPEVSRVRVTPAPKPGRTLHVAPDGKDTNPGTRELPFATVNQALAANRAAGAVAGGTAIELAAGRYPLGETIALTDADSGKPDAPLSIRVATPGTAVISGSKRLTGFTAVTEKSVLARLPEEARGKVLQCNLTELGITDFGSIQEQPMVNLAVNGVPQNLARWPNSGFVRVGTMVDNGNIDHEDPTKNRPQIFTTSDRISRWTTAPDAWLQGYLATNWMYGSVAIGSIDPQARTITTAWCYNRLSGWPDIKSGHPYAIFNLLEEIDQPGEWYLDRSNGLLYLYPGVDPGTAVVDLSMLPGTMLTVNNASHVRIEGLVFESSRGGGLVLENSSDCLIAGCTVRNVSGIGVSINGGQRNSMIGCNLHDLEDAAMHINGGDIDTLTPGGHVLANCRFRNFGRTSRSPGISLNGVGHRITHCVFEDCPSSAIGFGGFNFLVEYNEFRNCCNENEDYGVIYAWGNPTWRGNIWRFNKFSHCGGGYTQGWVQNRHFGTSAFRFDDAISGQTVYGNLFTHFNLWGTSAGVMGNNSGRDNIYDNNLVTDSRGLNYGYFDGGNHMYAQGLPNGVSPAHLAAFPELANLSDGKGRNSIWRSTLVRVSAAGTNAKNSNYADSEWGGWQYIANTSTGTDPGFVDGVELRKTIAPTLFWNLGMRAIPVEEIGLYDDPTSAASGDKSAVFAEPGGTITLSAPLVADDLIFTAPGYALEGTSPIIVNAPMTTIDVKTFGATISAPMTGLGGIRVAGPGTLTLSGSNNYNGTTTVESGTLALSGGDNRLPPGTVVTLGGGGPASFGTLKLNGCSQELDGLWTADYDNGATAGNRVINGSATPCTLTLHIEESRQNQFDGTLGGHGQDENNFAVRKTGGGGLWLNRSITWTGGTTIEEGSLELTSSFWQGNHASGTFRIGKGATFAVSGQVSPLTFNNVTIEFLSGGGGTLVNRGSSDWLTWMVEGEMTIRSTGGEQNLFSAAPNYGLSLNGKNLLCDIARGSDKTCDLLVSIPLSGDGNLTKQGDGIMTLSGSNSYSGATSVNAGTLVIETTGKTGNGNLTVENGATCVLRNAAGAVADNATVTLNGTGKLHLAPGVSETVGTLVIDGIQQPQGVWNAAKDPVHFTGGGSLAVTSGPSDP